jgi:hypothetical protein
VKYNECNNFEEYLVKTFFPEIEKNMPLWDYYSSKIFSYRKLHSSTEFKKIYGKLHDSIVVMVHYVYESVAMHSEKYQDERSFQTYRKLAKHIGVEVLESEGIHACFFQLYQALRENKQIPFMTIKENNTDTKKAGWHRHFYDLLLLATFIRLNTSEDGDKRYSKAMQDALRIIKNDLILLMKKYHSEMDDDYKDLRKYYLNKIFNISDERMEDSLHEILSDEYGYFEITGAQSISLNEAKDRYLSVFDDLKNHFSEPPIDNISIGQRKRMPPLNEEPIILGSKNIHYYKESRLLIDRLSGTEIVLEYPKNEIFSYFLFQGIHSNGEQLVLLEDILNQGYVKKSILKKKNGVNSEQSAKDEQYSPRTLLNRIGELKHLKEFKNIIFIFGDVKNGFYFNPNLLPQNYTRSSTKIPEEFVK